MYPPEVELDERGHRQTVQTVEAAFRLADDARAAATRHRWEGYAAEEAEELRLSQEKSQGKKNGN